MMALKKVTYNRIPHSYDYHRISMFMWSQSRDLLTGCIHNGVTFDSICNLPNWLPAGRINVEVGRERHTLWGNLISLLMLFSLMVNFMIPIMIISQGLPAFILRFYFWTPSDMSDMYKCSFPPLTIQQHFTRPCKNTYLGILCIWLEKLIQLCILCMYMASISSFYQLTATFKFKALSSLPACHL